MKYRSSGVEKVGQCALVGGRGERGDSVQGEGREDGGVGGKGGGRCRRKEGRCVEGKEGGWKRKRWRVYEEGREGVFKEKG